jgi:hypothetical protein
VSRVHTAAAAGWGPCIEHGCTIAQAAEAAGVSMRIVSKIVNTIDAQTEAG